MGQKHRTQTHREIMERRFGILPIREIARLIGYSPAAVFREIKRTSNKTGTYDAESAQGRADWRASKDKNAGKRTPFLTAYVQEKLAACRSPEQIAGRLRLEFPDEPESGFLMADCSARCSSAEVANVIEHFFSQVPASFFKSITDDQGKEFFNYKQIDKRFGTVSCFCHAGCPGERGRDEQTNGLLRQFFPRTCNVKGLKNEEMARAVAFITNRPRQKFGYKTTVEKKREDGGVSTFV